MDENEIQTIKELMASVRDITLKAVLTKEQALAYGILAIREISSHPETEAAFEAEFRRMLGIISPDRAEAEVKNRRKLR